MLGPRAMTALVLLSLCFRLIPSSARAQVQGKVGEPLVIRVRVFNVAQVCSRELARAQSVAREAFARAQIRSLWLDCTFLQKGAPRPRECGESFKPLDIAVATLPRFGPEYGALQTSALGFAAMPGGEMLGHNAGISMERVVALATRHDVPAGLVLGLAMAHEIAHLLLGPGSHAAIGLMRTAWEGADLAKAARGDLSFTPEAGEELRVAIGRRQAREKRLMQALNTASP